MTHHTAHRPVIAAIPSYNMGASLRTLLPQVLEQGYDGVYVLDDCSHDNTQAIVQGFRGVKLMIGDKNIGASGNRSRILLVANEWPSDTIIHFIDADVSLDTPHMPQVLRGIFRDSSLGAVGGLVREINGLQSPYNYGPRLSAESIFGGSMQTLLRNAPAGRIRGMRQRFPALQHWPDTSGLPQAHDTHYVLEGNMAMTLGTLRAIGGFDPTLRYNEAQDIANKVAHLGLRNHFDPSFGVTHLSVNVRGWRRYKDFIISGLQMLHRNKWPLR